MKISSIQCEENCTSNVKISSAQCAESCTSNVKDLRTINTKYNNTNINTKESEREANNKSPTQALGKYKNVYLNKSDFNSLKKDYPYKLDKYIERLSEYMKINGKKYKNHGATIRKWIIEDSKSDKIYDYDYVYEEGECL